MSARHRPRLGLEPLDRRDLASVSQPVLVAPPPAVAQAAVLPGPTAVKADPVYRGATYYTGVYPRTDGGAPVSSLTPELVGRLQSIGGNVVRWHLLAWDNSGPIDGQLDGITPADWANRMKDPAQYEAWQQRMTTPEGYAHWVQAQIKFLKDSLAANPGLKVILNMHTAPLGRPEGWHNPNTSPSHADAMRALFGTDTDPARVAATRQAYFNAWSAFSKAFRNDSRVVGYDLLNEPDPYGKPRTDLTEAQKTSARGKINDLMSQTVKLIRQTGDTKRIIVESWGGNPNEVKHLKPVTDARGRNDAGVEYSFHYYWGGKSEGTVKTEIKGVADWQDKQATRGAVKVFVGEWGTGLPHGWEGVTPAQFAGAKRYLAVTANLFNTRGWDWTYQDFAEDVERRNGGELDRFKQFKDAFAGKQVRLPPRPPTAVATQLEGTRAAVVSWQPTDLAAGGQVVQTSRDGVTYTDAGRLPAAARSFRLAGLPTRSRTWVRVAAVADDGDLSPSEPVSVDTPGEPPAAPSDLRADAVGPREAWLAWADNSGDESGFRVQVSGDGGATWAEIGATGPDQTGFLAGGLTPGSRYLFRVYAENADGRSAFSNELEVETPADVVEPPAPPGNPRMAVVERTWAVVAWDAPAGADTVAVQVAADGADFVEVGRVAAGAGEFRLDGLAPGTRYRVRLVAVGAGGETAADPVVFDTPAVVEPPPAPGDVTAANVWARVIDLNWAPAAGADWYRVYRSVDGVNFVEVGTAGGDQRRFRVDGLRPNTRYWFKVSAVNQHGETASPPVEVTTLREQPPVRVTDLRVANLWAVRLDLNWTPPARATRVIVEISTDGRTFRRAGEVGPDETRFRAEGLKANTRYWFRVRAVNDAGEVVSNEVEVRTKAK